MEFLLEIYTEEMPPSHVKAALSQLREKLKKELSDQNVDINRIEAYGTCRRLVISGDFAAQQKDVEEEITGPPKAVAYQEDGSPAPAAKGFAKSQGIKVSELEVIRTEKGEYLGLKKIKKGRAARDILSEIFFFAFLSEDDEVGKQLFQVFPPDKEYSVCFR